MNGSDNKYLDALAVSWDPVLFDVWVSIVGDIVVWWDHLSWNPSVFTINHDNIV